MEYRREIDGLRAVAVLPVVLFHAGMPGLGGGFIGVDVFFVISGYLITGLIAEDMAAGRFSIRRFYERRARRIIPALAVVLLATLAAGWALMLPTAFRQLGESASATALFLANVHFWQGVGYFDAEAAYRPLLHMWSLAVEEQFYLLFPLLFGLGWRRLGQGGLMAALLVAAGASLWLAGWGAVNEPLANYYFPFSRFWELLAGSLVALGERRWGRRGNGALAGLGLGLVLLSYTLFDERTAYPALPTLVPVLGTVLVLGFGRAGTWVARGLSLRPAVAVGLISYSLYLWHQPVLVFGRIGAGGELTLPATLALVALMAGLSAASWRFVEQPVRHASRPVLLRALAVSALVAGLGVLASQFSEASLRYLRATPAQVALLDYVGRDRHDLATLYLKGSCFRDGPLPRDLGACAGTPEAPKGVLIWGDSHAAALSWGLRQARGDVGLLATGGCAPLHDTGRVLRTDCRENNARVLGQIGATKPAVVLLHANWQSKGPQIDLLPGTLAKIAELSPATRVLVVGGVPQWRPSLPEAALAAGLPRAPAARLAPQGADVTRTDAALRALTAPAANARFIALHDRFCPDGGCIVFAPGPGSPAEPVAWDYGHLTAAGSQLAAGWLLPALGATD